MKMKKIKFLATFCMVLMVFACSSSSDDTTDDTPTPVDKSGNLLTTGDSANDILSNDNFTKLKIEIAHVTGFRPTQEAMNEFVSFLRLHTFKEEIEIVFLELPSPEVEDFSIQEIADLELENRTVFNDVETLGIYIYFADAPSEDDEEDEGLVTLGAVYRNTSMVIHQSTIRRLASLRVQISNADVETATLNHEFGHLFGLVNLGTTPVNAHEDSESENHCDRPGCLMRAELQFGGSNKAKVTQLGDTNELKSSCSLSGKSVLQILESHASKGFANAVPLDAECILDLQSNGGR